MRNLQRTLTSAMALLILLICTPAMAEQYVTQGEYTVHYMSMTTADLPPNVASGFGLRRSSGTALVMINVQHGALQGAGVSAEVTGTATNLVGQKRDLQFREVREDDAIYSIATLPVSNLETVRFAVQAVPQHDGATGQAVALNFSQKFYR